MGQISTQPERFEFTSVDGLQIACERWDSRARVKGVVQIAHGLGEHMGRYRGLIEALVQAGLAVYGNDHRGHGRTAASPDKFGDFGPGGFNLLVRDMARLIEIAKAEHPGVPFILLGHSMGSFAAQQYVLDGSAAIDGLALSGSGALDALVRLVQSSTKTPAEIVNAAFEPARTPCDPLCFGWLQPESSASFFAAAPQLADPTRLHQIRKDLPIYLFSGREDPVGLRLEGVRILLERYRAAGIEDITYDFYPGGRHEMLNEINREEVRTNLLHWMLRVVAGRL